MYRYFFHIGYKGTNYRGWQKQVNAISIQETIEIVLGKFVKSKVHCMGCGRTDAGVHASRFYFHVDLFSELDIKLLPAINKMLPADIMIYDFFKVAAKNHAQHSASARTYNYFLHHQKNAFLHDVSALYPYQLNVKDMQLAAQYLIGEHDFRAFCKTPDRHNHTMCNVSKASIYTDSKGNFVRFEIRADRFLKGMIRIIMQLLIEIGSSQLSIEDFSKMLKLKITPSPLKLAYPQGLYLTNIQYPFIDQDMEKEYCPMLDLVDWINV